MNLTDPSELRELLERHGLTPQKRWGQHFLRAPSVVDQIVSRLSEFVGILEVGPGPGVLTAPLSESAQKLIAIEIDSIAISALQETAPNAEVRRIDALKADLGSILDELPEPRALVSNMPYNITGPLLTAFAAVRDKYSKAVLMMQKEVAERVLARPGDRRCGSLSIFLQTQFEIEKVCSAPSGAFYPPPKVDSAVLQFASIPLDLGPTEMKRLFKVIRAGFVQPRKTLANNLNGALGFNRENLPRALAAVALTENVRPHQVPLETWKALSQFPLS